MQLKRELLQQVNETLEHNFEEIVSWRRHLHQHPELSFEETLTAVFIKEKLEGFGLEVKTNIGGNGLIGILQGEHPGPTIALRADFDALPIDDAKDVGYKSRTSGVMHACGHDGHTASLLGTAQALVKQKAALHGKVIFIFQHAEEKPPGGAIAMIKELDMEEIDYVFAAHLASDIPVGKIAIGDGVRMAAVDKFELVIEGKGGHGGRPQATNDPIVIGADVVNALQKIVSRRIDPLESAVVSIGVFQAGNAFNVIPNEVRIEGTVRTFKETIRQDVRKQFETIVHGIVAAYDAKVSIDYLHGYPALTNPKEESVLLRELFGEDSVVDFDVAMGAEDFAYFLLEKPGNYFKVGSRNGEARTQFPHHHPNFDMDERALLHTAKAFVKIVSHYLCVK